MQDDPGAHPTVRAVSTTLASELRHARSLGDLQRLLATLGVTGHWHSLDPAALPGPGGIASMAATEQRGGLPWIGLVATDARAATRKVARLRAGLGCPTGVACLDVNGRSLVVTVALGAIRLHEVPLEHPDPTSLVALSRIGSLRELPSLEAAARLAEILRLEPVGQRFFRKFRHACDAFAAAMPPGPSAADRHALALLLLTRVLFLYFVQSKGWLDARPDFLARAVDDCLRRRRSLHRHLLRPLFFGAINRPAGSRNAAARALGNLPFLNGGLFEPHALERRWPVNLSTEVWRSAFDELFEGFHFTTREGSGDMIAPDMLGRVFEGLMDPESRHQSGTYYTPSSLVRDIIESALAIHARSAVPLDQLTILDPAVGSGAFLLGALELLAERTRRPAESMARARRRVLTHNLFGVDLNPAAVRLAELRLWLAVISEDDAGSPDDVAPLPNLDAVVRQGDSLWSGLGLQRVEPTAAARLRTAREQAITSAGLAKRAALRELRAAELAAGLASVDASLAACEAALHELALVGRSPTLFGDRRGLNDNERRRFDGLRRERAALRASRRRIIRDGTLTTFDYGAHFADVMAAGGFDLVVGNPPWVRSEALTRALRQRLSERFSWYRTAIGRGYQHHPDLSVAFVERSLELTREGGVAALLVPAKLRHAGYAAALRCGLASTTTLHVVADVATSGARAFDATVYPMVLVAQKSRPGHSQHVHLSLDPGGSTLPQVEMEGPGPWGLHDHLVARIGGRLSRAFPSIGSRWRCHLGVKTGADDLYLTDEPDIEPHLMRRAVRGRDIKANDVTPRLWLRWPCTDEGMALEQLPRRASAWFTPVRARLERRADYRDGPPWMLFRTRGAVRPHRVVWPDLARRLEAAALTAEQRSLVPLNTCYIMAVADDATAIGLATLLNSTWMRALASLRAPVAASRFRRFNARVVEALPLPLHEEELRHPFGTPADFDEALASRLGLSTEERDALRGVAAPGC